MNQLSTDAVSYLMAMGFIVYVCVNKYPFKCSVDFLKVQKIKPVQIISTQRHPYDTTFLDKVGKVEAKHFQSSRIHRAIKLQVLSRIYDHDILDGCMRKNSCN